MDPEQTSPADLVALLASATEIEVKARACRQLAVTGGAEAVPALVALLGDERLSDHARCGLELIPLAVAGEALCKALSALKGPQLAGVVDSLGIRREVAAVPGLITLLKDSSRIAESAVLAALARIASDEAVAAIRAALDRKDSPAEARLATAHAALAAADRLLADGKGKAATDLLGKLIAAEIPVHLREAAAKLRQRAG